MKFFEKNKKAVTVFSIVAIAGSIGSMIFTQCGMGSRPKINLKPFYALGEVTGEETAKLLKKTGKVVIVRLDPGTYKAVVVDAEIKAFTETATKAGLTIDSTERIKVDPMQMRGGPEMNWPGDAYLNVLRTHLTADCIVSFMGAPELTDEQIGGLGEKIPKMVSVGGMGIGLKKLFENQIVQVAILPRFMVRTGAPSGGTATPQTSREWFDQSYMVVTAENVADLPMP